MEIRTDDKDVQREPTNDSDDDKNSKHHGYCTYCKYQAEPSTYEKCIDCVNLYTYKTGVTDNWEAKDE